MSEFRVSLEAMTHTVTLLSGPEGSAHADPETSSWLIMFLLDVSTVWIPVVLIVTAGLVLCPRRRPGGLLTSGPLRRSPSTRRRVDELRTALTAADGARAGLPDADALAARVSASRRWAVARQWLYGPAVLAPALMLYGALGGWGGGLRPLSAAVGAGLLALAAAATAAEAVSRRRADPYGEAVRRGVVALEALVLPDGVESRVRTVRESLRGRDRRPTAYFAVDWSFRTVEEFCLALERLARHAVLSGDRVGRARRVEQVRVYAAHVQESLERYRVAAVAHAEAVEAVGEARSHVLSLVSGVLADVCRDRLIVPALGWEDLPEDRRTAPSHERRTQTVWQAAAAVVLLIGLAGLFTWAGAPGEFVSPILFALSGAIGILLPRARWLP
ncbi:hypothetical protein AB0M92_07375 [Streptomyces sp. NPDC051582]|uniref:hypothetical protein n=1 Tax=Streptomyces sp. NPDC051582 TaxID=3155167 RepID=UPI00344A6C69